MGEYEELCTLIGAQQEKCKGKAPFFVGEQLKDMARGDRLATGILLNDLRVESMSIIEAEKKIKEYADKHKQNNFACVPPSDAEKILKKFYGLPDVKEDEVDASAGGAIDLADYL